jgi:glycosyltransferase involved in cell wall biosynthesis
MSDTLKRVIVFIPAYNEEDKIVEVIQRIQQCYRESEQKGFRVEILVVDDGSTDKTVERARDAGVSLIVSHPYNLGLGAATRTGMKTAYELGGDIALKMDADFQHDPADIEKVIQPILENRADIVFGSRFTGNITYKMPLHRKWGNLVFTWLMRKLTNWKITDAQTGLMVYARKYLADFNIVSDYNAPQQILIDAYNKHMRYMEVPVVFHPRTTGRSFVTYKYPFKVLPAIIRLLVLVNPLKVFIPVGSSLILGALLFFAIDGYFYLQDTNYKIHDASIVTIFLSGIQIILFGLLADAISHKK